MTRRQPLTGGGGWPARSSVTNGMAATRRRCTWRTLRSLPERGGMDWTLWAGFVVASLIVELLPGPGVTSIVGYALP